MKKWVLITMMFLMAFGVFNLQSQSVLAGEHGGSMMHEEGGGSMLKGSKDDAATLKEAASLLKSSNPALAEKLEKMSQKQCGL